MKLYVHKFPPDGSLANCREVADNAPAPIAPWIEMSVADFNTWKNAFVWSDAADPAFDPDTQKLVPGPIAFDDNAKTAIRSRVVVALDTAELQEVNFKKMDNWIATFDAGTATNAQLQTFAARVLRELKRLRGG